METPNRVQLTHAASMDPRTFVNRINSRVTCPKCKKKFHIDNFPGHQKYETEMENGDNLNNLIKQGSSNVGNNEPGKPIEKDEREASSIISESKKIDEMYNKYFDSESSKYQKVHEQFEGLAKPTKEKLLTLCESVTQEVVSLQTKCHICYKVFEEGEEMITLPQCFHNFHKEHLMEWVGLNKICPVCKLDIKESVDTLL